jgi:pyruvate,water dikinase
VARIIFTLADTGKLSPGDVMIAPTTSPPWTPFFRIASAVVTDAGGVLSHCAIVAREYGIPAVVGTGVGTTRIEDGQRIRVDGDKGMIRILG